MEETPAEGEHVARRPGATSGGGDPPRAGDERARLSAELSEARRHVSALQDSVAEVRRSASLYAELLAAERSEAQRLRDELAALRSSTSWRITAPLRWAVTKLLGRTPRSSLALARAPGILLNHPRRLVRRAAEIRALTRSGLFDAAYYCSRYPDVARSWMSPLFHFVWTGAREARDPNPMFDTAFYLARNPDVAATGVNPLDHYRRCGAREGRDPGPLFRTRLYLEENPAAAAAGVNPLADFLRSLPEDQDPRDAPFVYRCWVASYEARADPDAAGVRRHLGSLGWCPRVSLLVLAPEGDDTPALAETIRSVCGQIYDAWEIVALLPPGVGKATREWVAGLSASEPRVRAVRTRGPDRSCMLNEGLTGAAGDLVALLGAGDLLDERALAFLADELGRHPDAAVVYSDEDQVDGRGRRSHPHFKPDWSADLFSAWNYLGGIAFLDRSVVHAVGGFRAGFAPSHEYDLLLRVIAAAGDDRVRHIPWVLYHRRGDGAPAPAGACDSTGESSDRRALEDSLSRRGISAKVERVGERFQRVLYPLPEELPLVSIVVPTRNRVHLLARCLRSLARSDYPRLEVLVVDNDSDDPDTLSFLEALEAPHRVLHFGGKFNFSAINNYAVARAAGSVVVFLNNDIEAPGPSWLSEMVRLAARPDVGAVGARLCYPDGTVQHAGAIVGLGGVAGHAFVGLPRRDGGYFGRAILTQEYSAVTAACLAVRRSVFADVGGFDESFPVNFNDTDLCLRIRERGLKVLLCAQAELVHDESASRKHVDHPVAAFESEVARFRSRWTDVVQNDPFYSPNLSLSGRAFSLAVPPRKRTPWELRLEEAIPAALPVLDPYASIDNWARAQEVLAARVDRSRVRPRRQWRPGLSVVILTLDNFDLIAPLLDQLLAAREALQSEGVDLQVVVGDTGSTDERVLRKYEALAGDVDLERGLRYHFSRCNNRLFFERVGMDKTLFLNNDVVFADARSSLVALAGELEQEPDVGVAGALLTYPDGRVQHAGIQFHRSGPLRGFPYHPHHGQPAHALARQTAGRDWPAVTGACLAIRSDLFAELGGFDEEYRTECQDIALCLAARRLGYRCRLVPAGRIDHVENGTRPKGSEDWLDRQRLIRRWRSFVEAAAC